MARKDYKWDFFIAHAGADKELAENLYALIGSRARVFLDSRVLQLGDNWDSELAQAQNHSWITVVLVSNHTDAAYYQRDEIANAIAMARKDKDKHRIIPVYLDGKTPNTDIPYGLRLTQGISMESTDNLSTIAAALLRLLARLDPLDASLNGPLQSQPPSPVFSDAAKESRRSYQERVENFVAAPHLATFKSGSLLPVVQPKVTLLDCICAALSREARITLILPGRDSQPNIESVGRTALIHHLLGIRAPYSNVLAKQFLDQTITFDVTGSRPWKLLAADMAYLCVCDGDLSVIPIRGELLSFMWDAARHLYRSTDLTHTFAAHRENAEKRQELVRLFYSLLPVGLTDLYLNEANVPLSVEEIIVVSRKNAPRLGITLTDVSLENSRALIEESIGISSEKHGSPFWRRSEPTVRELIRFILGQVAPDRFPSVRQLTIKSTLPDGDTPGFLYEDAARRVSDRRWHESSVFDDPQVHKTKLGTLFVGIDAFNSTLFQALSRVSTVRILVISGEKVFYDGAFWRTIARKGQAFKVEILMLRPDSPIVREFELASYKDKPNGFLEEEIGSNLQVIQAVADHLRNIRSPVQLTCWLYDERPALRMTLLDETRTIFSHYIKGSRTGRDTLFLDVDGLQAAAFRKEYFRVKEQAQQFV